MQQFEGLVACSAYAERLFAFLMIRVPYSERLAKP
jgi:hypothetical protein